MLVVRKKINGICEKEVLGGIGGDQPPAIIGKITISASVGNHGVNMPHDTVTIQNVLNQVPLGQGRPNPPLDVDTKCGPKTKRAIQEFQLKQFGWSGADGLVEPRRQTINRLFVGSPEIIDDHAYNHQGDKINRLTPPLKVLNAESYSNFAWEVSHPGMKAPI